MAGIKDFLFNHPMRRAGLAGYGIGADPSALGTFEEPKPVAQLVGGATSLALGQAARMYIGGTLGGVLGWPLIVLGALGAASGVTRVASSLFDKP